MSDCSICLEEIDLTRNNVCLECSHSFHLTCMLKYCDTTGKKSCPLCRGKSKIFIKNTKMQNKLRRRLNISNGYFRESVIAFDTLINSSTRCNDKIRICKTVVERYREIMEDITDSGSEDFDFDGEELSPREVEEIRIITESLVDNIIESGIENSAREVGIELDIE